MESLLLRRSLLFLVLHCGTSGWFGVSPVVRQKSCEEMRKGDVYVIGTEEEAGMGLDSCDQDWSSVSALENNSIQLAYFYNSTAEFMSPVVQLSQRKIVLDACVSIALHLECSKKEYFFRFLVTEEPKRKLRFLGLWVAGVVAVLLIIGVLSLVTFNKFRQAGFGLLDFIPDFPPGLLGLVRPGYAPRAPAHHRHAPLSVTPS